MRPNSFTFDWHCHSNCNGKLKIQSVKHKPNGMWWSYSQRMTKVAWLSHNRNELNMDKFCARLAPCKNRIYDGISLFVSRLHREKRVKKKERLSFVIPKRHLHVQIANGFCIVPVQSLHTSFESHTDTPKRFEKGLMSLNFYGKCHSSINFLIKDELLRWRNLHNLHLNEVVFDYVKYSLGIWNSSWVLI